MGVEFSGNPVEGAFPDYIEVFEEARASGFKISVHSCEFRKQNNEQDFILDFKPNRLGHCTYSTEDQLQRISNLKIPVEICPTSN